MNAASQDKKIYNGHQKVSFLSTPANLNYAWPVINLWPGLYFFGMAE